MRLIDKRIKKQNNFEVNTNNIKQLLTTIGITPTEELLLSAMEYFSDKKITMPELYKFLQQKSIVSINDEREVCSSHKLTTINESISDIDNFLSNMYQKGYAEFTSDFLVKQFNDITINITLSHDKVTAISGYNEEQELISIPDDILQEVKEDINSSNNF